MCTDPTTIYRGIKDLGLLVALIRHAILGVPRSVDLHPTGTVRRAQRSTIDITEVCIGLHACTVQCPFLRRCEIPYIPTKLVQIFETALLSCRRSSLVRDNLNLFPIVMVEVVGGHTQEITVDFHFDSTPDTPSPRRSRLRVRYSRVQIRRRVIEDPDKSDKSRPGTDDEVRTPSLAWLIHRHGMRPKRKYQSRRFFRICRPSKHFPLSLQCFPAFE